MQLGDARTGKLADNLSAFGRTLRRAGVRVDSSRSALAAEAALAVGLDRRADLSAAMEAVLVSREQDRDVFRGAFVCPHRGVRSRVQGGVKHSKGMAQSTDSQAIGRAY